MAPATALILDSTSPYSFQLLRRYQTSLRSP